MEMGFSLYVLASESFKGGPGHQRFCLLFQAVAPKPSEKDFSMSSC
jgi:hypothetical protein